MNIFTRIHTGILSLTGRGGLSNPIVGRQSTGGRGADTLNSLVVDEERTLGVSTVWSCVGLITETIASLPLKVYQETEDGFKKTLDRTNYLARLLTVRPNLYMNPLEFRTAMAFCRTLKGNAYAIIQRNSQGVPVALHPMDPDAVTVYRDRGDVFYDYQLQNVGRKTFANLGGKPREIFHWRGLTVDGINGLSPLAYHRHLIGGVVSAERQSEKAFSGRPNGIMYSDADFTKEQAKAIRERYEGKGNQPEAGFDSNWWLLPPKFKWQQTSLNPDDLQMLETRQFSVPEICRFYRVPAVMVDGFSGGAAWPASYEGHVQSLLTFTLKPYLEGFEAKVTEALSMDEGVTYAEHDVEQLLRADAKGRAQYWSTMVQNGIMTRNEVRKKENMKPLDGLDEATVQLNLTPATELGLVADRGEPRNTDEGS